MIAVFAVLGGGRYSVDGHLAQRAGPTALPKVVQEVLARVEAATSGGVVR